MKNHQLNFEQLEANLIIERKNDSVKTLKKLILLTQLVKFLHGKFFLFIITIIPFIIISCLVNFNIVLSSFFLGIHLCYWIVINLINFNLDSTDEINKLNVMIEVYKKLMMEREVNSL